MHHATNRKILADRAGSIEKFLTQGLTHLGDRLGPIHWQFMATKKFDRNDFAGFLPRDWAKGDRDVFIFFISGAAVRNPAAARALIAKLAE